MENKTLEQIQEENRKLVILANNPEAKSYDEALEMELGFGCRVSKYIDSNIRILIRRNNIPDVYFDVPFNKTSYLELEIFDKSEGSHRIIGKPLTLDRVLIATQHKFFSSIMSEKESVLHIEYDLGIDNPFWIDWNLTKPTLEEQRERTQREINKLLTQ